MLHPHKHTHIHIHTPLTHTQETRSARAVLSGHTKGVTCLETAEAWQAAASGDSYGVVKLWDLQKNVEKLTLNAHDGAVHCVRPLTDHLSAPRLVSGGQDGALGLYDVATGERVRRYNGHEGPIRCVASWGEDVVVTASTDMTLRVWDTRMPSSGRKLGGHKGGVRCLAIAADPTAPLAFSGAGDGAVFVWDLRVGRAAAQLTEHNDGISALTLQRAADGAAVRLVSAGEDARVVEYDIRTGERVRVLERCHNAPISCLSVTAERLVTGAWDSEVRVWDSTPLQG